MMSHFKGVLLTGALLAATPAIPAGKTVTPCVQKSAGWSSNAHTHRFSLAALAKRAVELAVLLGHGYPATTGDVQVMEIDHSKKELGKEKSANKDLYKEALEACKEDEPAKEKLESLETCADDDAIDDLFEAFEDLVGFVLGLVEKVEEGDKLSSKDTDRVKELFGKYKNASQAYKNANCPGGDSLIVEGLEQGVAEKLGIKKEVFDRFAQAGRAHGMSPADAMDAYTSMLLEDLGKIGAKAKKGEDARLEEARREMDNMLELYWALRGLRGLGKLPMPTGPKLPRPTPVPQGQ